MAYIGKFRDGWRAQVQRDGVRVSKTFALKKDAQAWALEQESKKSLRRDRTLAQACGKYLESVSTTKRNAVDWERRRLDAFCAHFGEIELTSITSEMIGAWRDQRLKTVSGSTVLREVNLYRNLFKIAVKEWKWLSESPFDGVRLPQENPARKSVWGWREIRRVLRARRSGKTAEMQQAFRIALHTGLRLQEVLTCAYDEKRKVLILPISKTEPKPVEVPVLPRARKIVSALPSFTVGANEGSALFSRLSKELLIEGLTFHDSRATALTLLSRKMDVLTLSRISRHKDLNILMKSYYRESAEQISARL
ncbi:MAG: tyrosine-type recombinase/integrase [Burkholderiaceae bacterium]